MRFTLETIDKLVEVLEDGEGPIKACEQAGIGFRTLYDWLDGDIPKDAYIFFKCDTEEEITEAKTQFSQRIKRAEEVGKRKGRAKAIDSIFTAMEKSWLPAAWWLERNYKEEFGERKTMDIQNTQELEEARHKLKQLMESLDDNTEGQEGQNLPADTEPPKS